MDGVRIGRIELKSGLDVRPRFLEFAGGRGNGGGEAMVNRTIGIEVYGVLNVLRGQFKSANAVEVEGGEVMREWVVRSGLEQHFDVVSEVAVAIEVQRGESTIVMEIGGVWIPFKRAGGLSEDLLVMAGFIERGNSANGIARIRHR